MLAHLLSQLTALSKFYQFAHWKTQGQLAFQDHLLFERLYNEANGLIDGVAEKSVGLFGNESIDVVADATQVSKTLTEWKSLRTEHSLTDVSLKAVRDSAEYVESLADQLRKADKMTEGLENLLQGISDKLESHIYLLQQRTAGKTAQTKQASYDDFGEYPDRGIIEVYRGETGLWGWRDSNTWGTRFKTEEEAIKDAMRQADLNPLSYDMIVLISSGKIIDLKRTPRKEISVKEPQEGWWGNKGDRWVDYYEVPSEEVAEESLEKLNSIKEQMKRVIAFDPNYPKPSKKAIELYGRGMDKSSSLLAQQARIESAIEMYIQELEDVGFEYTLRQVDENLYDYWKEAQKPTSALSSKPSINPIQVPAPNAKELKLWSGDHKQEAFGLYTKRTHTHPDDKTLNEIFTYFSTPTESKGETCPNCGREKDYGEKCWNCGAGGEMGKAASKTRISRRVVVAIHKQWLGAELDEEEDRMLKYFDMFLTLKRSGNAKAAREEALKLTKRIEDFIYTAQKLYNEELNRGPLSDEMVETMSTKLKDWNDMFNVLRDYLSAAPVKVYTKESDLLTLFRSFVDNKKSNNIGRADELALELVKSIPLYLEDARVMFKERSQRGHLSEETVDKFSSKLKNWESVLAVVKEHLEHGGKTYKPHMLVKKKPVMAANDPYVSLINALEGQKKKTKKQEPKQDPVKPEDMTPRIKEDIWKQVLKEEGHEPKETKRFDIEKMFPETIKALKERKSKGENEMLDKLFKTAYMLDSKGLYSEADKIDEMIQTLAKRVGISLDDLISTANYLDETGMVEAANVIDGLLKKAKFVKPPKKWFDEMVERTKKNKKYKDFSKERIDEVVAGIWKNYSEKEQEKIRKTHGPSARKHVVK